MIMMAYHGALLAAFVVAYIQWGILAATAVVTVGVTVEVVATLLLRRRPSRMQWVGLILSIVLGGATLVFRDPIFFELRPTGFYWLCASVLAAAQLGLGANAIQVALGRWITAPAEIWSRLQWISIGFLTFLGLANIVVVYRFSTDIWVMYRVFGPSAMTTVLMIAVAVWLRGYPGVSRRPRPSGRSGQTVAATRSDGGG